MTVMKDAHILIATAYSRSGLVDFEAFECPDIGDSSYSNIHSGSSEDSPISHCGIYPVDFA